MQTENTTASALHTAAIRTRRSVAPLLRFGLWSLLASAIAPHAGAKIIYVSPSGSNSGNGTTSPYQTVQRAMWDAGPGDFIYLKGGTYYPAKDEWIGDHSGNAGARITIQSAPGEWAILDGSNANSGVSVFIVNASYIRIQQLEVRNSKQYGIDLYGANNEVNGCYVSGSARSGIHLQGDGQQVLNSYVWNNCKVNVSRSLNGWPAGVDGYHCTNAKIISNHVWENWGEGILFQASDRCYAGYNSLYDNFSTNMYLDSATNCTYDHNSTSSNFNTAFYRFNAPAVGIMCANEWGPDYPQYKLNGNVISNNTVTGCRFGFYVWNGGKGGGNMQNTHVYGNAFQKATSAVVQIDSGNDTGSSLHDNTFGFQWSQNVNIQATGVSVYANKTVYQ